jgi:hypothetical protein
MEVTVNIPGVINEEVGGKSILPKNSVRVASGFSLLLSLSVWCSLIVFHIKYYWNLFLISLMSTISVDGVWLLCLYNRRHGAEKAKTY